MRDAARDRLPVDVSQVSGHGHVHRRGRHLCRRQRCLPRAPRLRAGSDAGSQAFAVRDPELGAAYRGGVPAGAQAYGQARKQAHRIRVVVGRGRGMLHEFAGRIRPARCVRADDRRVHGDRRGGPGQLQVPGYLPQDAGHAAHGRRRRQDRYRYGPLVAETRLPPRRGHRPAGHGFLQQGRSRTLRERPAARITAAGRFQ